LLDAAMWVRRFRFDFPVHGLYYTPRLVKRQTFCLVFCELNLITIRSLMYGRKKAPSFVGLYLFTVLPRLGDIYFLIAQSECVIKSKGAK
jgi:hypothetical protein